MNLALIKTIVTDVRCRQILLTGYTAEECLAFRALPGLSFNEQARFKTAEFEHTLIDKKPNRQTQTLSNILNGIGFDKLVPRAHVRAGSLPGIITHPGLSKTQAERPEDTKVPLTRVISPKAPSSRDTASDQASIQNPVYRANRRTNASLSISYPDLAFPASRSPLQSSKLARYDRQGRRLDTPINPVPPSLIDQLEGMRLCNKYHLKRTCTFPRCKYLHQIMDEQTGRPRTLNEEEVRALRLIARRSPCREGVYCQDAECFAGHRCPNHTVKGEKTCCFPEVMHYVLEE